MVITWGTGRKDYSANVEMSVVPTARSYQVNAIASSTFSLGGYEIKNIAIPMEFSPGAANHFIFNINVTADANVLIGVDILSEGQEFITEQGYQEVNINIPQGLGLSELTLVATNYSSSSINMAYSHNGVQGAEKIMPIVQL